MFKPWINVFVQTRKWKTQKWGAEFQCGVNLNPSSTCQSDGTSGNSSQPTVRTTTPNPTWDGTNQQPASPRFGHWWPPSSNRLPFAKHLSNVIYPNISFTCKASAFLEYLSSLGLSCPTVLRQHYFNRPILVIPCNFNCCTCNDFSMLSFCERTHVNHNGRTMCNCTFS